MISIILSLFLTFSSVFSNNAQKSNTTDSKSLTPQKVQKNIEEYFKLVRKAAKAPALDYKVIKLDEENRYMKISFIEDGKPMIAEVYYLTLGFDLESDHILLGFVPFKEGYGTIPEFVIYKDGELSRPKLSELITNWNEFSDYIGNFETNKTSDPFCCDLRIFLPTDGSYDFKVYSVTDEGAVKLKDRPSTDKLKKIGTLVYDMLNDNFEFVVD
jgi:hypothetical protein